jgi:hypothetical protein
MFEPRLSPALARLLVVAPPIFLSLFLGSLGYPVLPRAFFCLGVGTILILLVARHQRGRSFRNLEP